MSEAPDWRTVDEFWFPPALKDETDLETHGEVIRWWFAGGANSALQRFAPIVEAAENGRLNHWLATAAGRLSLIIVLDQFPRGLFAGTPRAYASDPDALRIAEEGLGNGQYDELAKPWEKSFFALPLTHAEGPDHKERLERAVKLSEQIALAASKSLQPIYEFGISQVRGHLDVISHFGRYPHRNGILGRVSSAEEITYIQKGDFVHLRRPILSPRH
jgi:uncharacterized protein (DUF924 family)